MKKRILILIIIILIIIRGIVFALTRNNNQEITESEQIQEYTPEEEISSQQLRETTLTLFFLDKETQELKSEGKLIDSSNLLQDPYKLIVQYLIDGPTSDTLETVFPENTRIIDASIEQNCVTLNFSEELLNYQDDTQKYNIINSILNSLTQLTEVNSIKFLINGEPAEQINEEYCAIH